MRIQTRLFLGIAVLVLVLTACQWWLHVRQLRAVERRLSEVATTVGKGLLVGELDFVANRFAMPGADCEPEDVRVITMADDPAPVQVKKVHRFVTSNATGDEHESHMTWSWVGSGASAELVEEEVVIRGLGPGPGTTATHRIKVEVVDDEDAEDRFLVVSSDTGAASKIPIPVMPAVAEITATQRQGLFLSGGLLVVGLVASGFMANRMARPLRDLARRAERLGEGELGAQVEITASGEVGDLQRAFNDMSRRLAQLEEERERWREREHLAQLGDLSRGLAHTLRNPLNTLGLAVEELASSEPGDDRLVTTARAQIGRIDRWLKSFLALGAGDVAAVETVDLGELVTGAALETAQQGSDVEVEVVDEGLAATVVASALRAAVANLLENAAEAVPATGPVEVRVLAEGGSAMVEIADRGPGLSEEVRARLFSPHVTTKSGGSGMGLFLARQLIVGMNGGELAIADRDGGGTVVTIRLARAGSTGAGDGEVTP